MNQLDAELVQIAAVAKNGVIGRDGDLPWKISADLKFFKEQTSGHIVIMGRRTFEEIKCKPLPKRLNIVISRKAPLAEPTPYLAFATSLENAIDLASTYLAEYPSPIFIIGGGEIYRQSLPWCNRLLLTHINAVIRGDTFFPEFDKSKFDTTILQSGSEPEKSSPEGELLQAKLDFQMVEYRRRPQ